MAAEGGEVEFDHRSDGAVALPGREIELTTEGSVRSFSRRCARRLNPSIAGWRSSLSRRTLSGRSCSGASARPIRVALGGEPPATDGFVALEVRPREGAVAGAAAERHGFGPPVGGDGRPAVSHRRGLRISRAVGHCAVNTGRWELNGGVSNTPRQRAERADSLDSYLNLVARSNQTDALL